DHIRTAESCRGEMLTPQAVSRILKRRGGDSFNYAPQSIGSFATQECPQPAGLCPLTTRGVGYAWVNEACSIGGRRRGDRICTGGVADRDRRGRRLQQSREQDEHDVQQRLEPSLRMERTKPLIVQQGTGIRRPR